MTKKERLPSVGIDIGGTFIKVGVARGKQVLVSRVIPMQASQSAPRKLTALLAEAVGSMLQETRLRPVGVGIGIPGLVRYERGIVRRCVNIKGWKDVPLKQIMQRKLKLPVWVDNDVNVMTLAEWKLGAGKGSDHLVCLTLGTGVGGGLVLDGRVYRGHHGSAGEVGHTPLSHTGPGCPCGGMACMEQYVGNRQIIAYAKRQMKRNKKSKLWKLAQGDLKNVTPELIDRACEQGDVLARAVWRYAGEQLGLALTAVVNLCDPERIVIGGGISKAGRWIFDPIRDTVRRRAMVGLRDVRIVPARLGTSAGVIGAALLGRGMGDSV